MVESGEGVPRPQQPEPLPIGKAEILRESPTGGNNSITRIALSNMNAAARVSQQLEEQGPPGNHFHHRPAGSAELLETLA